MGLRESLRAHQEIHLKWTIFVLALVVIGLTSVKLGTNEGVKDLLSFALSFSSLILAIIAIIQSLLSNSAMAETNTAVNAALRDMQGPASQISEAARQLTEHSTRIEARADELSSQIRALNSTQGTTDVSTPETGPRSALKGPITSGGRIALYLLLKSHETGKAVDTTSLNQPTWIAYVQGFIAALNWAGIVSIEVRGNKRIKVKDFKGLAMKNWDELLVTKNVKTQGLYDRYRARIDAATEEEEKNEIADAEGN